VAAEIVAPKVVLVHTPSMRSVEALPNQNPYSADAIARSATYSPQSSQAPLPQVRMQFWSEGQTSFHTVLLLCQAGYRGVASNHCRWQWLWGAAATAASSIASCLRTVRQSGAELSCSSHRLDDHGASCSSAEHPAISSGASAAPACKHQSTMLPGLHSWVSTLRQTSLPSRKKHLQLKCLVQRIHFL
jgi:hypothetical protein